jgi:hypothetical protein
MTIQYFWRPALKQNVCSSCKTSSDIQNSIRGMGMEPMNMKTLSRSSAIKRNREWGSSKWKK